MEKGSNTPRFGGNFKWRTVQNTPRFGGSLLCKFGAVNVSKQVGGPSQGQTDLQDVEQPCHNQLYLDLKSLHPQTLKRLL